MILITIAVVGLVLAYANGANDNFKGVATLFGRRHDRLSLSDRRW